MTLRIFVGSAREAEAVDTEIRSLLEASGALALGWRDLFRPGDYPIDALMGLSATVDGALLIVTPDDLTTTRGTERRSPRDNILLELGMLLSHFGKRRTGIVHVQSRSEAASLPSDLHGITTLLFDSSTPAHNEKQLRLWLEGVMLEIEGEHPALPRLHSTLRTTFRSLPPTWHEAVEHYVVASFMATLKLASQGQIVLTPGQYYQALYDELDKARAPTEIIAVASLSSTFWREDRDQRIYVSKNAEAVRRGADIRRLFIVPDGEWAKLNTVVRKQLELGINIRRAKPSILAEATGLEDMVMFVDRTTGSSRAYITDPAFDNPTVIRRARLFLDAQERNGLLEAFERVWATASMVTIRDLLAETPPTGRVPAPQPARNMKEYALARPVVSCEEAAAAKGISLDNELKTLILTTKRGPVALHLLGDGEASLRAVKNALEVREASLAAPAELAALGLQAGTVCAVKDPVWSLPHLISRRVLTKDMVSTNNGTHRGFYRFHPSILMEADSVMIGEFERDQPTSENSDDRGWPPIPPIA